MNEWIQAVSKLDRETHCLVDLPLAFAVEPHNSRLEALGDAVLSVVASHHAFAAFPWGDEGVLSDARCGVIGTKLFALFSLQLGLPALLHHGDRTPSGALYADATDKRERLAMECLESFFGAIYLDRGLGPCRSLLARLVFPLARDLPLRRAWLAAARRPYSPPDTAPRDPEAEEDAAMAAFEEASGIKFRHFGLLRQAFTHPSVYHAVVAPGLGTGWHPSARVPLGHGAVAGGVDPRLHNQRLEWLGDALLNLAACDFALHYFPESHEEPVTLLRTALVNNAVLIGAAVRCGMHRCVRHKDALFEEEGSRTRGKMLADAFEAFLGALYLDRQPLGLGLAAVKAFTAATLFEEETDATVDERRWMDPKARLQHCLNEFSALTGARLSKTFELLEEFGPAHERMYVVGCYINGALVASARGLSITDAQMGAALRALESLHLAPEEPEEPEEGEV